MIHVCLAHTSHTYMCEADMTHVCLHSFVSCIPAQLWLCCMTRRTHECGIVCHDSRHTSYIKETCVHTKETCIHTKETYPYSTRVILASYMYERLFCHKRDARVTVRVWIRLFCVYTCLFCVYTCLLTHAWVWHNSFMNESCRTHNVWVWHSVAWFASRIDSTYAWVWHNELCHTHARVTLWVRHDCCTHNRTHNVTCDILTWLIHECDITHYVTRDVMGAAFMNVTLWVCVWHESCMCVTWLMHVTLLPSCIDSTYGWVRHNSFMNESSRTHNVIWVMPHSWRHSVTWLIHVWVMSHSCTQDMAHS